MAGWVGVPSPAAASPGRCWRGPRSHAPRLADPNNAHTLGTPAAPAPPPPTDPSGELYTALGFSPGFAPDVQISAYAKLLPMLAGIGSPGTIQEASWVLGAGRCCARGVAGGRRLLP